MIRKPKFLRRVSALLVDYGVILCWITVVALVNVVLLVEVMDGIPDYLGALGPYLTQAIFFFILTFPVGLYFTLTEASKRSASIGKRKTGLKVQCIDGQSALRAVVKLPPWEIAHAFIL